MIDRYCMVCDSEQFGDPNQFNQTGSEHVFRTGVIILLSSAAGQYWSSSYGLYKVAYNWCQIMFTLSLKLSDTEHL